MKTEIPREAAERLVDIWRKENWLNDGATDENANLVNAVVSALNAERERAAKIADKDAEYWRLAVDNYKLTDPARTTCIARAAMAQEIAARIRGKQ